MDCLIVKTFWADMILSGEKPWEIRGSRTHKRGTIGIIKSGTGKLWGEVDLVDCIPLHGPDDYEMLLANESKHRVPLGAVNYKKPWAWIMEKPTIYPGPIPYNHPQGAIIWVKI